MNFLVKFLENKLHYIPHIVVYEVVLKSIEYNNIEDRHYFLTNRAANRFLKMKNDEIVNNGLRWDRTGGVNLWLL